MGLLRNVRTGRTVALGARVSVGRAGTMALCIDSRLVSNDHAALWWEGGRWMVRDNGSRNGTKLEGRTLAAGERARMAEGDRLAFGHEEHTWQLLDSGAPVALARSAEGEVLSAVGGVLGLPAGDEPEVTIYEGVDGAWISERADGHAPVRDGAVLVAGGRAWTVSLPVGETSTWAADSDPMPLAAVTLRFRVSLDEEYIELALDHVSSQVAVPARAHHELLLALARARIEDAAHPAPERGWRYADALQRMLGIDAARLNVHIFRARQQLGDVGITSAASVIERRPTTGQLRLGIENVAVEPLATGPQAR